MDPEASSSADVILTGGRFFTANPAQPWANAVAIRDGRLVHVGDAAGAEGLAGTATRRHDLGNRLVLPGLIDSHTHPGLVSGSKDVFILPDTLDPDELLAAVAAREGSPEPPAALRAGPVSTRRSRPRW